MKKSSLKPLKIYFPKDLKARHLWDIYFKIHTSNERQL